MPLWTDDTMNISKLAVCKMWNPACIWGPTCIQARLLHVQLSQILAWIQASASIQGSAVRVHGIIARRVFCFTNKDNIRWPELCHLSPISMEQSGTSTEITGHLDDKDNWRHYCLVKWISLLPWVQLLTWHICGWVILRYINIINKSAQSNLGRGPCHGAVAHVRRKVPIGYNGAPQSHPQKYPCPWTDLQTELPASSLDPSDLWCQTASGSDSPFFRNALDRPTDRSFTGKVWWL